MIKEVIKYSDANKKVWGEYDTEENLKDAQRRQVLQKYIGENRSEGTLGWWEIDTWQANTAREYYKKGYKNAQWYARDHAIREFMKFYEDIQAQFKKIDEQEITKEVKNA